MKLKTTAKAFFVAATAQHCMAVACVSALSLMASVALAETRCVEGLVWREAGPNDYVCVTPAMRTQVQRENELAARRRRPGSENCRTGFVWREAFEGDKVCVTPQRRAETQGQNASAGRVGDGIEGGQSLKVRTNARFGAYGELFALHNVEEAFARASGSRDVRHKFGFSRRGAPINGQSPDTFHVKDHIQSFGRLSGDGYNTHFVLTRNARDAGDGGIYVGRYDQFSSDGNAWKWSPDRSETRPVTGKYYYERMPRLNHAGGVQILGQLAFVAGDCDGGLTCSAEIGIYDLRDTRRPSGEIRRVNTLVIDDSVGALSSEHIGSVGAVSSRAAAVAAARLEDGKYILFVRGRQNDEAGWFFISTGDDINTTGWRLLDFWRKMDLAPGTPWEAWETVNFIAEAGTGKLFMLGLGTTSNKSFLYEVQWPEIIEADAKTEVNFRYVAGRGLNTQPRRVNTRYGAGAHITPSRQITTYVTARGLVVDPVKINEFRSR
ncbi:MAG: hypothetical protein AAGA09_01035 [Pseudomonadota bacterium]